MNKTETTLNKTSILHRRESVVKVAIVLCQQRILGPKFKTDRSDSIDQSGRFEFPDHHQRKCQESLDFKREPCPPMVETFVSHENYPNWPVFLSSQPI